MFDAPSQFAGIGFGASVLLAMLALCFLVAHRLRPGWGLGWVCTWTALSALRGFMDWTAAGSEITRTPGWLWSFESLTCTSLAALAVGMRAYVGRGRHRAWLEFAVLVAGWFAVQAVGSLLGLGPWAGPAASTLLFGYLGWLCLGGLRPVTGQTHALVAGALLTNPPLVMVVGIGVLRLGPQELRGWSSLTLAVLGLALLMATVGRLRLNLEGELEARQRAEERLRQLNESLEQRIRERTEELEGLVDGLESFNRMVSHDLRGPLGGLSGVTMLAEQALQRRDLGRVGNLLTMMGRETQRLNDLVHRLLLLARVSHAELARARTSLDEVLKEALAELAASRGEQQVVHVRAEPLPHATIDPQLMRQVFVNLVDNALKFAGRAPEPMVQVRAREDGSSVVIEVRDNGPGFEPGEAQRLFQPFSRLHGRQFEGTGIGLTIVRRIVERHGGQVWAEGRPAHGASFFFSLPRAAA